MPATLGRARSGVIGRAVELRFHPRVEARLDPGGDDAAARGAYAACVTEPTFASLERTRARQQRTLGLLRPVGVGVVVLVVVTGVQSHPRPSLSGEGLAVLLALIGFAAGAAGVMRSRRGTAREQVPFFLALIVSSALLVALQPKGPAFVGAFMGVAAAMRLRGRPGVAIVVLALVLLPIAEILGKDKSAFGAILQEIAIVAFALVARLAGRLAEGQEQAERLLRELEQTRDAQARAAVLAERQRLAREMHDVLAHSLSGLALQLEGARLRAAGHDDPALVESLERAHHLARSGIEEARRAIGMLRDEELPGPERLAALVAEFERDTGIPATLAVAGESGGLGPDARLTLFRTAQEALTNVRKHARAERVELRVAYEPAGTRLCVEDFGAPPQAAHNGGGYGLTGMRERAELLGGTLTAAPTSDGFRVELWVPA